MSDYDDDYMVEDEDYDLEYSEDSNSEPDVDLENQYYNSKSLKVNLLFPKRRKLIMPEGCP